MIKYPDNQTSIPQSLEIDKSFCEMYVIEATAKEQLKMQEKELAHQKVVMELKIENLRVWQKVNELEEKLDLSVCSKKLLEMSIDKLKSDGEFLESKIKICEEDIKNGDEMLAKKKEEWRKEEKSYKEEIRDNKKEKQKLSEEKSILNSQYQQLEKNITEQKEKSDSLLTEKTEITEFLKRNFKHYVDDVHLHENHDLITLAKQKLDQYEKEINDARSSLNKFEGSEGFKGSSINNFIDSIYQHLKKSKETIEKMRVERYEIGNEILKKLVQDYQEEKSDKILEVLQNEMTTHFLLFNKAKSNVKNLKGENEQLKNTIKENENEFNETEKKLTEKISLLEKSVNALTEKEKQLNKENDELKIKLKKCEEEIKHKDICLETASKETENNIQNNLDTLREKEQEFTRCNNELQKLQPMLREKESKILSQSKEIEDKSKEISDKSKEIEELKDKIDTLENQINRLEDKSKKLSEKCEGYEGQLSINKKQSEGLNKEANERALDYENQLKTSQKKLEEIQREEANLANKLEEMQKELVKIANKHIQAYEKEEEEIRSYHQAVKYFESLISQSSGSSTSKKEDLFPVPSLSKTFECQENWINDLISVYSNSKRFTSKFVARFEFISPRDLETYLSEPNILIICETSFKKVFGIFICKLSKTLKDTDPVVLFSSDYSLTYPSEPKKGNKCRPAMIVGPNLALAKKEIVIEKSLQVSLENGEYFGDIDKYKLFGIEDNSSNFKIEKMEIHRIITEQ